MSKTQLAINLVLTFALALLFVFHFSSDQKIVYVDSNKLLSDYKGMQDARAIFQKKAAGWKANIDTLTNEVKNQIMDYEMGSSKMSPKERQLSEELIRTKQNQLSQYQQAMNAQAQQEDQKMTSDVLAQVNAFIKKYGDSKGFKIVLGANEYGNVAYADEDLDITAEVLEGLNKQYTGQ